MPWKGLDEAAKGVDKFTIVRFQIHTELMRSILAAYSAATTRTTTTHNNEDDDGGEELEQRSAGLPSAVAEALVHYATPQLMRQEVRLATLLIEVEAYHVACHTKLTDADELRGAGPPLGLTYL
uniref:Uncharacterized protein n=1 Tax=Oryza nivara TaxID=4536 RepID=A0A0E0J7W0_ORYNI